MLLYDYVVEPMIDILSATYETIYQYNIALRQQTIYIQNVRFKICTIYILV